MTRAEQYGSRFLLLVAPQTIVSALAIAQFTSAFQLPAGVVALHVFTVLTAQCLFFLGWGLLARVEPLRRSRLAAGAYAAALFAKALALNFLYVGSYGTKTAWGDNLSPANLLVIAPHLEGFRQAFGNWVLVAAGCVGAAMATIGGLLLWRSARRWEKLTRAFPTAGPWWPPVVFTAWIGLCTLVYWQHEPALDGLVRADPILSFCANRSPLTTTALAEVAGTRDYPTHVEFHRRHVIVITVDCLRADHLPLYGYARDTAPFLTALQQAGRLQAVPVGFSAGNESQEGIFAVLSSHYARHQHPTNFKLYDLLKRLGYRTWLVAAGDHSTFSSMRALYGKNFDLFSDGLDRRSYSVNDDRAIVEKLAALPDAGAEPTFLYLHLMSVHALGVRDPQFARWSVPASATAAARSVAAYDNAVLQADHLLGQIFATLERKGYLRDYVGAITGDHGEGLGERNQWGHTRFLFNKDIGIPILFVGSALPPAPAARIAAQVDIAPTLLQRLGLPIPATWEGYAWGAAPARRDLFLQGKVSPFWRGVVRVDGDQLHKYLFTGDGIGRDPELLFDLAADPAEAQNLIARAPAGLVEDLRRTAAHHFDLPLSLSR